MKKPKPSGHRPVLTVVEMPHMPQVPPPDYGRSIPFRFDRALSRGFRLLGDWMTGKAFEFYKLGSPGRRTFTQISAAVDCILANLIDAHQISPKCFVAISRSEQTYTKSRYLDVDFGYDNFVRVLDFLTDTEPPFVEFKKGFFDRRTKMLRGFRSRYRASDHFVRLLNGYPHAMKKFSDNTGISMDNVSKEALAYTNSNPLSASGKATLPQTATIFRAASDIIRLRDSNGKDVDYEDANQTIEMRSRLQRWNYFISEHHHIDLLLPDKEMENVFSEDDDEKEPEAFFADEDEPSYVELSRVRLHRIFNNSSFEQGGRFYGAWWQSIPKIFRKRITINEHATREFDYSNLHAAMLYAIEGLPLPDDAYVLDGFKEYRPLVKTTFFKLINAGADQKIEAPRSDALPAGWSWSELLDAVKEKHAPIAKYLHSGIGLKLQRVDSDIAETVMLRMMEKDILVLPVHDSFVTYHELQSEIRDEMVRAYKERMNTEVGIDADASFVDEWNKEAAMGVDFDAYDVVENEQTRPGYEGYQKRHVEFFRTRSNE